MCYNLSCETSYFLIRFRNINPVKMGGVSVIKDIIDFLDTNINGRTLNTKELVYKLESGRLQGVYSDQTAFSNLKYSQSR